MEANEAFSILYNILFGCVRLVYDMESYWVDCDWRSNNNKQAHRRIQNVCMIPWNGVIFNSKEVFEDIYYLQKS